MRNEKKLVEAFKAFMEKGVFPFLPEDHVVLNEWKFLSGILTLEPIDQTQIDFYLLMANKNHQRHSHTKPPVTLRQEVKNEPKINTKKLLASMQSFQGMMSKNQEKLENLSKKEINPGNNTSIQGKKNG